MSTGIDTKQKSPNKILLSLDKGPETNRKLSDNIALLQPCIIEKTVVSPSAILAKAELGA